jgi:Zn-dependent membrane protease YugP
MYFFNSGYFLFVMIPALLISALAQATVSSAYSKWRKRANSGHLTGADVARQFSRAYGFQVNLEGTPKELGDHFDPRTGVVRLSPTVARDPSVASMAIAAHEFGHVQQYAQNSPLIAARGFIMPVAQFGSTLSFILIILGMMLNAFGLAMIGVILFAFTTLFSVLTLPIELDASRRALKMLEENGMLITHEDRSGARAVLRAAALTYVAALLISILNLVYYAMLVSGMGGRRRG